MEQLKGTESISEQLGTTQSNLEHLRAPQSNSEQLGATQSHLEQLKPKWQLRETLRSYEQTEIKAVEHDKLIKNTIMIKGLHVIEELETLGDPLLVSNEVIVNIAELSLLLLCCH